ncbi:MAG: CueP family metal-binding protein [Syntrophales bacterium]
MVISSFKNIIATIVMSIFILYSQIAFAQHGQDQQLRDELKGIDAKKAMKIAYKWRSENIDVKTFVTPDAVNFQFKDGKTVAVPLPDDLMIVSIAPYVNKTHPCATHTMSSCDAELKITNVKVVAVTAGGKTLINKTMKTAPTGFLDLWLPRNQAINITVNSKGKSATGKIFTNRDSKTCETTLKLE